jgi:hypothetical protein
MMWILIAGVALIIAVVIVAVVVGQRRGRKRCPHCTRFVMADATVCPYCTRDLF